MDRKVDPWSQSTWDQTTFVAERNWKTQGFVGPKPKQHRSLGLRALPGWPVGMCRLGCGSYARLTTMRESSNSMQTTVLLTVGDGESIKVSELLYRISPVPFALDVDCKTIWTISQYLNETGSIRERLIGINVQTMNVIMIYPDIPRLGANKIRHICFDSFRMFAVCYEYENVLFTRHRFYAITTSNPYRVVGQSRSITGRCHRFVVASLTNTDSILLAQRDSDTDITMHTFSAKPSETWHKRFGINVDRLTIGTRTRRAVRRVVLDAIVETGDVVIQRFYGSGQRRGLSTIEKYNRTSGAWNKIRFPVLAPTRAPRWTWLTRRKRLFVFGGVKICTTFLLVLQRQRRLSARPQTRKSRTALALSLPPCVGRYIIDMMHF